MNAKGLYQKICKIKLTHSDFIQSSKLGVRCSMFIFLLLLTLSCSKNIPEQKFPAEYPKFNLLITGVTSEFKQEIISRLLERYKDKGNVNFVDISKINQMQCVTYDAIVVMDSVQAWSLWNFSLKSFLERTHSCKNIVLLFTADDPEWKYKYRNIDAITSASIVGDEDRVFNELTTQIDELISKI